MKEKEGKRETNKRNFKEIEKGHMKGGGCVEVEGEIKIAGTVEEKKEKRRKESIKERDRERGGREI